MTAETILVSQQDLAETYTTYNDPWTVVNQYQHVLEYTSDHPNRGSSSVASALDLPRSRIRTWINEDGRPDCVRGIQAAEERDWIPLTYESDVFEGMNVLVAWVFSGGSISNEYHPYFSIGSEEDRFWLAEAFERANVQWTTIREDESGRAAEARPTEAIPILGRILVLLGAPMGGKNSETAISLPDYLDDAPEWVRHDFARTYLLNRVQEHPGKRTLTLREERSEAYLNELASLFADLSGGPITVSEKNVVIPAETADRLIDLLGVPDQ